MSDEHVMSTYTITRRPLDFPDREYTVRQFDVRRGGVVVAGPVLGHADTLDEAREIVPPWADACLPRAEDDDPKIVETWI